MSHQGARHQPADTGVHGGFTPFTPKDDHDGDQGSRVAPAPVSAAPTRAKQHVLDELLAERFSGPIREYRPAARTAPLAELLELLTLEQDQDELRVIRDTA